MLRGIPCVLMRGGSSKGLFFLASDLPADSAPRDRLLLAAMGSPDTRQIDGLGGGDDQSSKVMVVGPSMRPGADVEYLFAQVSVSRDLVDIAPNSGNMLAGVAPFAIERGLVSAGDPATVVRMLDRNTGKIVEAIVQTPGGKVTYRGDCRVDGVPGTCAPIALRFIDPAGGRTGRLLPTGNVRDRIDGIELTCIDFANPLVMVAAQDLGKTGHESKTELDADAPWIARLEALRRQAALRMGMGDVSGSVVPKVLLLAPPRRGGAIASRYFAPSTCHATHALTGAVGLLAACNVPDSVAARIGNPRARDLERIDIEHPGGHLQAFGRLEGRDHRSLPVFSSAGAVTTARPLFTGTVFVRSPAAGADENRDPTPDRTAGGIGP